jgi:anaphase-promoting complex subunit 10
MAEHANQEGRVAGREVKQLPVQEYPSIVLLPDQREVTDCAVWSVSTAKTGSGLKFLLDNDTTTFWQSDGNQPHFLTAHFPCLTAVEDVYLYLDYKADESYTPAKLSVRTGLCSDDIEETNVVEIEDEPTGWVRVPILARDDIPADATKAQLIQLAKERSPCSSVFVLQVGILANFQSGRDSHVRGIRVVGPMPRAGTTMSFTSAEFQMMSALR